MPVAERIAADQPCSLKLASAGLGTAVLERPTSEETRAACPSILQRPSAEYRPCPEVEVLAEIGTDAVADVAAAVGWIPDGCQDSLQQDGVAAVGPGDALVPLLGSPSSCFLT